MQSITLADLAVEEGLKTTTIRHYIRVLKIQPHFVRVRSRGNQPCAAITQEQLQQFRQWREENGFYGGVVQHRESA